MLCWLMWNGRSKMGPPAERIVAQIDSVRSINSDLLGVSTRGQRALALFLGGASTSEEWSSTLYRVRQWL